MFRTKAGTKRRKQEQERWRWQPGVFCAPPHCGERPCGCDNAVTQGQVSDHPSQATKTSSASQGWTWLPCQVKRENVSGTIKHGQHLIVVPNAMLAVAVNSSSKHALSRRRQAEKYLQNCSGAPECLRLSKVPAVHCNIAKTMGQPGNPEQTPLLKKNSPKCPYASIRDEYGHHAVQNQKRWNTSIFTKREVVLADRALSSQYGTKSSRVVMTVTNIEDKFRCFNQKRPFLIPKSDLNVPFCGKSSRGNDSSNETTPI